MCMPDCFNGFNAAYEKATGLKNVSWLVINKDFEAFTLAVTLHLYKNYIMNLTDFPEKNTHG